LFIFRRGGSLTRRQVPGRDSRDVSNHAPGRRTTWGAGSELQEHGGTYLIGVDTDSSVTAPEFAAILLTNIERRFDFSVVQAARSIVDGDFTAGVHTGRVATAEVGISPFHNLDALVSPAVKADLTQITADIIAGKIKTSP
jgi:basic membrane protein A and related proteins